MANIIYDEKRTVRIGEVCAINLKNIHPIYLILEDPEFWDEDIVNFFSNQESGISSDDEITFIKYIGNGLFMDLVSDQLLITEVLDADALSTGEFELDAMDRASIDEMRKMEDFWNSIQNPTNKSEFSDSFSIFMQNPLAINVAVAPFMSINSENTKKFASQSLEQVRTKMMSAKAMAQQGLKQQYSQLEGQIVEHFSTIEKKSAPKTM